MHCISPINLVYYITSLYYKWVSPTYVVLEYNRTTIRSPEGSKDCDLWFIKYTTLTMLHGLWS